MPTHQFAFTLLLVVLTIASAGFTSHLENNARFLIAAQALLSPEHPTVLRSTFHFCWVGGGAILGGYVAVALRHVTGLHHIVKYFAVAVATSLATSPYLLTHSFGPVITPEACFLVGFLVAVAAWLGWELLAILAKRLKRAAATRGWLGIKEELLPSTGVPAVASSKEPVARR